MIPISSAIPSGFTWSEVSRNRIYELKLDDKAVATLQRPSYWSFKFVAEAQNGRWIFRPTGCLSNGAEILDAASQRQIATFKQDWGGGSELTFTDGQTFRLECKGWWRPQWSVIAATGETLFILHAREKTVEMTPGTNVPESQLSLLILFAWYRILKANGDAAAAVLVAAM
jgi:hypothetical protein